MYKPILSYDKLIFTLETTMMQTPAIKSCCESQTQPFSYIQADNTSLGPISSVFHTSLTYPIYLNVL